MLTASAVPPTYTLRVTKAPRRTSPSCKRLPKRRLCLPRLGLGLAFNAPWCPGPPSGHRAPALDNHRFKFTQLGPVGPRRPYGRAGGTASQVEGPEDAPHTALPSDKGRKTRLCTGGLLGSRSLRGRALSARSFLAPSRAPKAQPNCSTLAVAIATASPSVATPRPAPYAVAHIPSHMQLEFAAVAHSTDSPVAAAAATVPVVAALPYTHDSRYCLSHPPRQPCWHIGSRDSPNVIHSTVTSFHSSQGSPAWWMHACMSVTNPGVCMYVCMIT